jgi:single-strand DNA-binding protein
MAGLNVVQVIGNLGKDPEVRFTTGGQAVANFSVAVNDSWTDKATGQKKERTEWVRVSAWGKTAELCGEYLKKGRQVYVSGRLSTREYQDKEGRKAWSTEVVADRVLFLGGGERGDAARGGQAPDSSWSAPAGGAPMPEDLPF